MNTEYSQDSDRGMLMKTHNRKYSIDIDAIIRNTIKDHRRTWIFKVLLIISTICSASLGALLLSLPSTPLIKFLWRNIFSSLIFLPLTIIDSPLKEFTSIKNLTQKIRKYFIGGLWFTLTSVTFVYSLHNAGLGATCILSNFDVIWIILFRSFQRELRTLWRRIWLGMILTFSGIFFCYLYSESYWLICALLSSFSSTIFILWGESCREKKYWIAYFSLYSISSVYLFILILVFDGVMAIFDSENGFSSIFYENNLLNVFIVAFLTSLGSTGLMYSISKKITPSLHSLSILIEPTIALVIGSILGFQEFFAISLWIAIILSISAYVIIKKKEGEAEDDEAEKLFFELDNIKDIEPETSASFLWMMKSSSYTLN